MINVNEFFYRSFHIPIERGITELNNKVNEFNNRFVEAIEPLRQEFTRSLNYASHVGLNVARFIAHAAIFASLTYLNFQASLQSPWLLVSTLPLSFALNSLLSVKIEELSKHLHERIDLSIN